MSHLRGERQAGCSAQARLQLALCLVTPPGASPPREHLLALPVELLQPGSSSGCTPDSIVTCLGAWLTISVRAQFIENCNKICSVSAQFFLPGYFRRRAMHRGSMAPAHSRQIVEDKLKSVQHHVTAKAARKKLIGTVVQKGGVITVGDVRASFQAREESELQKAEAAA